MKKRKTGLLSDPSLFLDRDGVINVKLENRYVTKWKEFQLADYVPEALILLSEIFPRIFVVTNQQGIGKGVMSENDLRLIHENLSEIIFEKTGFAFTDIFYCPHHKDQNCNCRKPKIGMALQAKKAHPEVRFNKSWMVGDSMSDMIFGKKLNMTTVFIDSGKSNNQFIKQYNKQIDFAFNDLLEFANYLKNNIFSRTKIN